MTDVPLRCVIDTNVALTANGANEEAPMDCVAACARALDAVTKHGHLFVDDPGEIVAEYMNKLSPSGQPGPGDAFLKWVLTHQWGGQKVTRVSITKVDDERGYEELPLPPEGVTYDPSDRKFLAVAAASPERPPILQAFDSKWWGWREALKEIGVEVHFLCPDAIAAKYAEKMGQ